MNFYLPFPDEQKTSLSCGGAGAAYIVAARRFLRLSSSVVRADVRLGRMPEAYAHTVWPFARPCGYIQRDIFLFFPRLRAVHARRGIFRRLTCHRIG